MERVHASQMPSLRDAALIMAFAGWNDAAQVATSAARLLAQRWSALKFAAIDPEEFYDFTQCRPLVRLTEGFRRQLEWPANEFFSHADPHWARDFAILIGVEPQLKWKTFAGTILDVARRCGVTMVVMLGGLMADVPHSRPVRLTGSANEPQLAEQLKRLDIRFSRYEGPTGIIGIMHDACAREGIPAASIWGNVPYYLGATPNPKVVAALLERLGLLLHLGLDLSELEGAIARFEAQVAEALARNPDAAAYVRQLEEREREEAEERPAAAPPDLPSAEAVIKDLEDLLRRRREEDEPA